MMYGPIYVPARLMRNHRPALRSFSVAVPARKEGDLGSPKPRGFLAEYVSRLRLFVETRTDDKQKGRLCPS